MDKNYFIDNLDRALEEGWIKAYYQPLVHAASGRISDEETFTRWEDPKEGTFTAAEFIPILDEAKLTYKLDLYMVERVLKKMKAQAEHGLFVVPDSINLSGVDFEYCDMVTEITKLIDSYGASRDKLAIELSEKTVASNIDLMKKQVERFRSEGIKVWMDNYGSGFSTMGILMKVHFDLLKIDREFVKEIDVSDTGKIIITELIKTAIALGMDTVAQGVETRSQLLFLREIGCIKHQGYYYIEPVSLADVIERHNKGIQIGFINPAEADYYRKLGRLNLYDISLSKGDEKHLNRYFDTIPMVVFELSDTTATFVRCNKSYRDFVDAYFPDSKDKRVIEFDSVKPGVGYYSFHAVRQCAQKGKEMIIDDRTPDGHTLQMLLRKVAENPVTNVVAVEIAVMSMTDSASSEGLTYNYVARALSEDYIKLYFVDLDDETFSEYTPMGENRDIVFKKLGDNYFDLDREAFDLEVYEEDLPTFKKEYTKENFEKQLKETGVFSMVTRLVINGVPTYASVKAVKTLGDGNHVIVGINNVDTQIKSREIIERAKEERLIYTRIGALTGNFFFIYTVDPETGHYNKYNPAHIRTNMGIPDEGDDFFGQIINKAHEGIYKEDLDQFLAAFNKHNVFEQINMTGMFENEHRLIVDGKPRYVAMRATIINEEDQDKLIVGIINIDAQIRREQEYARSLNAAEIKANIDALTGIKNKHSYDAMEKSLNKRIQNSKHIDFAICVFDLNGLKQVNDTLGHQEGDKFIKRGCDIICRFFKHSPVYRVGGDEFVVIAQGYDYLNIDSLIGKLHKHNIKNQLKGDVVIACGMSRYEGDGEVAPVYKRADEEMYKNKAELKKITSEA